MGAAFFICLLSPYLPWSRLEGPSGPSIQEFFQLTAKPFFITGLALPDDELLPSQLLERLAMLGVPLHVASQLGFPILSS